MGSLQSAYDEGLSQLPQEGELTLQRRVDWMTGRKGAHEPVYTSYTYYWKTTLGTCPRRFPHIWPLDANQSPVDYIFFTGKGEVRSLIRPHRAEDFGAGLPRRGVCASDHVSLGCSLFFPEP